MLPKCFEAFEWERPRQRLLFLPSLGKHGRSRVRCPQPASLLHCHVALLCVQPGVRGWQSCPVQHLPSAACLGGTCWYHGLLSTAAPYSHPPDTWVSGADPDMRNWKERAGEWEQAGSAFAGSPEGQVGHRESWAGMQTFNTEWSCH